MFKTRDELIYHSAVHATENLTCPLCKAEFDDLDAVTDHIRDHSVGEQYPCDYCDLIFTAGDKLEEHCLLDHEEDHRGNEMAVQVTKFEPEEDVYEVMMDDSQGDFEEGGDDDLEEEEQEEGNNVMEQGDGVDGEEMELEGTTTMEEDDYIIEELHSPKAIKQEPDGEKSSKLKILKDEKVNLATQLTATPVAATPATATPAKVGNEEVLAEFEVRKSVRPKRFTKTYQTDKSEYIGPDDVEEEDNETGEDFSGDDEDVEYFVTDVVEESDEEEEVVKSPSPKKVVQKVSPPQKKPLPTVAVVAPKKSPKNVPDKQPPPKPTPKVIEKKVAQLTAHAKPLTQIEEKVSKFIQTVSPLSKIAKTSVAAGPIKSTTESDKNKEIANVLKNLPKGIAVKTETVTKETPLKAVPAVKVTQVSSTPKKAVPSKSPVVATTTATKEVAPTPKPGPKTAQKIVKTPIETNAKPSTSSAKLPIKPPTPSTSKSVTPSPATTPPQAEPSLPPSQFTSMKIGDKMVKVHKLKMTRDQVEAMKKEGKVEMKDGAMILKKPGPKPPAKSPNTPPEKAQVKGPPGKVTRPRPAKE